MLLQTCCQEAAWFSPDSSTFIFFCGNSNDLKKGEGTHKQGPEATPLYTAI